MITVSDLDDRLTDIENYLYTVDTDLQILLDNQVAIADRMNEIIEYHNRLFQTNIEVLPIVMEKPQGEDDET